MNQESVSRIIQEHRDEMESLGIHSLAVFGSTVRGDANNNSDIDLLVEFNHPVGLLHFSKVRLRLEELLGRPVDLVSRKCLIEELKEDILFEAVNVM